MERLRRLDRAFGTGAWLIPWKHVYAPHVLPYQISQMWVERLHER